MYNMLGVVFSIGVWTTFILFVALIVSKSWIIFIFILLNIAFFIFVGLTELKKYAFMKNIGSLVINGLCTLQNWGISLI